MKKNNAGFTLVEVMVVVAILAVCTGIIGLSTSAVSSTRAKSCANEICSLLSECRFDSMSRSGTRYVRIYAADDGIHAALYTDEDGSGDEYSSALVSDEIIGSARLAVSCSIDGGDAAPLDSAGVCIAYARSTGAQLSAGASTGVCSSIAVTGGSMTYILTLYPSTGTHELEASA